jgi:hypothetical protein
MQMVHSRMIVRDGSGELLWWYASVYLIVIGLSGNC